MFGPESAGKGAITGSNPALAAKKTFGGADVVGDGEV